MPNSKQASQRSSNGSTRSSKLPAPFNKAPANLAPFLEHLDKQKVYIVHLDTLPKEFKRKIFAVPVALHIAVVAVLLWRAYAAYPTYVAYILHILGHTTSTTIDVYAKTWQQLAWITIKRSAILFMDYSMFKFLGWWPVNFFLGFPGPGNPVTWRWTVGFSDSEVVVRFSRAWGVAELWDSPSSSQSVADSEEFKKRILPAIDRAYVRGKTGYLMIGADWDLDFHAMTEATKLARSPKVDLKMNDFQTRVLAYMEPYGWLSWDAHKSSADEEDIRRRIVAFRDRLTVMGKESLFYRWIELMQFESRGEDEIDPTRQAETIRKARDLFTENGVNFDDFVAGLGGVGELPTADELPG